MSTLFSALRCSRRWAALPVPLGLVGLGMYRRMHQTESDPASCCEHPISARLVTASHVRQLEREGFVVLHVGEAFANPKTFAEARSEVMSYFALGRFSKSANGASVRQDLVCWLQEEANSPRPVGDSMLQIMRMLRGLAHAVEAHGYAGSHHHYVASQLQLGWYPGDGASGYARHFDHSKASLFQSGLLRWLRASDRRARCLTAIVYLNDPSWSSKDGGALRCYHEGLSGKDGGVEAWTDVLPQGYTLILFDSKRIEHEVLPTFQDRFALTCWVTGEAGPDPSTRAGM
mmetsp:Transcript_87275/g.154642  ORF Transcript_87275/g.154642 Transcript_87275/m.154642 type:complete len:288 (-) Transcript_87275:197-1060(-)